MKKKALWVLFTLLLIECIFLGIFWLKPFDKLAKENTSSKSNTETKTSTIFSTSTSDSTLNKNDEKPDISKWITSDEEISFPILMYHSLTESDGNSLKIPPREFKEHMQWLKDNDYYTLTPEEAYLVLTENKKPAEKIVWVTLDDGYLNNYTDGFPILQELKMTATINYITSKLGSDNYFNLDQMKEMIASSYINIESHTVNHLDLNTLENDQISSELGESKKWLDDKLSKETTLLCYPAGRYDERVEHIAEETGYKFAITTEPGYARKSDGMFALKRVRISPGYDGPSFGAFIQSYQ